MADQVPTGHLDESQRADLLRTIEERQREVAQRRQLLERLRAQLGEHAPLVEEPKDASSYLKEAMALAEQAKRAVAAKLPVLEVTSSTHRENDRTQEAAKSVERPPNLDTILPAGRQITILEKSCQTDHGEIKRSDFVDNVTVAAEVSPPAPDTVTPVPLPQSELRLDPEKSTSEQEAEVINTQAELTEEERRSILESDDFRGFVERTTLTLEKLLNQDRIVNVFRDYTAVQTITGEGQASEKLGDTRIFEEARFSSHRPVHAIRGSSKFQNVFLATYGRRRDAGISEADGTCLMWSLESNGRPEHIMISHSPVTCADFSPTNPHIVIGGTSAGSVLLWDVRVSQRPVQKTRLVKEGHHCQIQAVRMVGSTHTPQLLTIDEESRACLWTVALNMTLTAHVDLKFKGSETSGAAAGRPSLMPESSASKRVLTLAADVKHNRFVAGTEDGSVYHAAIASGEVVPQFIYSPPSETADNRWHRNPISSISIRPDIVSEEMTGGDLVLTSSLDWTVRLWDGGSVPLHSFEPGHDYVFATKWSPSHPCVFACADGSGCLSLYNLNKSWYQPVIKQELVTRTALTTVEFVMEGKGIVAGTSTGQVVSAPLSQNLHNHRGALSFFENTLEDLRARAKNPQGAQAF